MRDEFCECVPSNDVDKEMICNKIHICDFSGLHELYGCVSSNVLLEKMIYHKVHIYDLCGLHEFLCDSSNIVVK